jgi:hypothetical protein
MGQPVEQAGRERQEDEQKAGGVEQQARQQSG